MGKTIMVIDDEENNLELVKAVLEPNGLKVLDFSDAKKAFATLRKTKVDLVLLDMRMPGLGGKDFCTQMKEEGIKAPVVFFTASKDYDNSILKEYGAIGFLYKPFEITELPKQIKAFIK